MKRSVSIIYGFIIDPHNDQLLVGAIDKLVEHCSGIAEVRVPIPLEAWIFQAFLATA